MKFINNAKAQLEQFQREKKNANAILKNAPKERLVTIKSKGKKYYYTVDEFGNRISLQHQPQRVKKLLQRDYLSAKIKNIDGNIKVLSSCIKKYKPFTVDTKFMMVTLANNQNPFKSQDAKHIYNDIHFRSKSELNFAQILNSYNIEFWYEPALTLKDEKTIYPDFIIKRPSDGKMIIIEYFGMMSDDQYRENAFRKIERYHQNGYYMWEDFIAIFEYKDSPINLDALNRIVTTFLL